MELLGGISVLDAMFGISLANVFDQLKPKTAATADEAAKVKAAIDALEAHMAEGVAKLRAL
jgi:cell division protein FtsB